MGTVKLLVTKSNFPVKYEFISHRHPLRFQIWGLSVCCSIEGLGVPGSLSGDPSGGLRVLECFGVSHALASPIGASPVAPVHPRDLITSKQTSRDGSRLGLTSISVRHHIRSPSPDLDALARKL